MKKEIVSWRKAQEQELVFWSIQKYDIISGYKKHYSDMFNDFPLAKMSVLEIGCGAIPVLNIIDCHKKTAIDPLMDSYLKIENNGLKDIGCINGNAEYLTSFTGEMFDAILLLNVLDHAFDWEKIIEQARVSVYTGGLIYVMIDLRKENETDDCHPTSIKRGDVLKCFSGCWLEKEYNYDHGFETYKAVWRVV